MAPLVSRTMHWAQAWRTAIRPPPIDASIVPRATTTVMPRMAVATTASVIDCPDCEKRLLDRMDQRVHGGYDGDGDEPDHRAHRDDERRLHHRDHLLEAEVDLFCVVIGGLLQVCIQV